MSRDIYFDTGLLDITINKFYPISVPFENFTILKSYVEYDGVSIDIQCNQYGDSWQYNGIWFQYSSKLLTIVTPFTGNDRTLLHGVPYVKNNKQYMANNITKLKIRVILQKIN